MRLIMVETALTTASILWTNFHAWHPASQVTYTIFAVSVLSAILITRMMGATALISIPASFVILYYSAMVGNFAALSIPMIEVGAIEKALIFSVIGHFVGGVLVLSIFRVAEG
jgi:hypothetical protein